jgi:hypothetical protein
MLATSAEYFSHASTRHSQRIFVASYSERLKGEQAGTLDVVDIYDLLQTYAAQYDIQVRAEDAEEWGQLITEDLKNRPDSVERYDTLLIDETQDMRDWMLGMLELHAHDQTTICVASGRGQELYGQEGSWLKRFRDETDKEGHSIGLRRNFRNYRSVFQMAHVFYTCELTLEKIDKAVEPFRKQIADNSELPEFDRAQGPKPTIVRLDEFELHNVDEDSAFFPELQRECRVKEYARIIREQLDRLEKDERPLDLLILVPNCKGLEAQYARAALQLVHNDRPDTGYIDYTDEDRRRDTAQPHMIRLCTYHSSRGLEGHRVVIFGLEGIEKLAANVEADPPNLGYIALSRSLFECVIVVRNAVPDAEQRVIRILETIRSKLSG